MKSRPRFSLPLSALPRPMDDLSETARAYLARAGWTEDRAIDTSRYEQANRFRGFFVGPKAVEFLRRFGDLRLEYPHFRAPASTDYCVFSVMGAMRGTPHLIREYEAALGTRLTVVGAAFSEHMTVCVAESGEVYAGFENVLCKLGDSGSEAINCLTEGREPVTVEYESEDP